MCSSNNKTTITISGFPGDGYTYGWGLVFHGSSRMYLASFSPAAPSVTQLAGATLAPTGSYDSTNKVITLTFSASAQIGIILMGGTGRFGTIAIS